MKKLLFLALVLVAFAACDSKPVVIEVYPPNDTVDTLPLYLKESGEALGSPHGIQNTIGE